MNPDHNRQVRALAGAGGRVDVENETVLGLNRVGGEVDDRSLAFERDLPIKAGLPACRTVLGRIRDDRSVGVGSARRLETIRRGETNTLPVVLAVGSVQVTLDAAVPEINYRRRFVRRVALCESRSGRSKGTGSQHGRGGQQSDQHFIHTRRSKVSV